MDSGPNIAVIGSGVIGLTAAQLLQQKLPKAKVTILADKFEEETTSHVAAGIFLPRSTFKGLNEQITKKWIRDSWEHWYSLLTCPDAPLAGVTQLSAYLYSKRNATVLQNPYLEDLLPVYRPCSENELRICPGDWRYGYYVSTLLTDCTLYLPWAKQRFLSHGGNILKKHISSFNQLSEDKYDVIINCSGLGARQLCNDTEMIPIRGQVIKVKAPWIKTAFYNESDAYIIPGSNGIVTLGGTRQFDSYNLNVCKYDAAAIMERCSELLPALSKAKVIKHAVGLRPHRVPVRIEPELLHAPKPLKVVHCYGHGAYGVTTAPGTASYAVDIGLDLLRSNLRNKL